MRFQFVYPVLALSLLCPYASAQWVQTSGPEGGQIHCIVAIDSRLFAGTSGGVFLSTNAGTTWTPVNAGLWNPVVVSLVVLDANLFAATNGAGVFRSTNYGETWTNVSAGFGNLAMNDLAVAGTTLFAATGGAGIYRSSDYGAHWFSFTDGVSTDTVEALAVLDANLFAGTRGRGVFRSTTHTAHWIPVNTGLSTLDIIALDVIDTALFAGTWGGGAFWSTNRGDSWVPLNAGLSNDVVYSFESIGTFLFTGAHGGLFRSTKNGEDWTTVTTGLRNKVVRALSVDGTSLLAGTWGGVFRSANNGENWTQLCTGMRNTEILSFAITGTHLYAGTWGSGMFHSSDGGGSWEPLLEDATVFSLAFTDSEFYAASGGLLLCTPRSSVNWTFLQYPDSTGWILSLAARKDTLFVGTEEGGLFRTLHKSPGWWESVQVGFRDTVVNCLLFDGPTLYAGTGMGVYGSADGGWHWTTLTGGLANRDVRALAFAGTNFFAGTVGGGVYRSTDYGANWAPVNNGLTILNVMSLAVKEDNLFAGTWNGGVFLSKDYGDNWEPVNTGLTDPVTQTFAVTQTLATDGTYLYAGDRGTGVWRRQLSEMITSAETFASSQPSWYSLEQNYPNPFNPSTIIKYELPKTSVVRLSVYDLLGREVSVLVNERKDAGVHEVKFDGSNLASGVYFYRLQAGDFVQSKRLLLLK